MKREEIVKNLVSLRNALAAPLTPQEIANGWTVAAQQATLAVVGRAEQAVREKREWTDTSIGRGLDHWGVEGGPLFLHACRVFNELDEIED